MHTIVFARPCYALNVPTAEVDPVDHCSVCSGYKKRHHVTPAAAASTSRRSLLVFAKKAATEERTTASNTEADAGPAGLAAIAAGLVCNPIMLYSEYVLKTTGAGLPPGPGGIFGALGEHALCCAHRCPAAHASQQVAFVSCNAYAYVMCSTAVHAAQSLLCDGREVSCCRADVLAHTIC